MRQKLLAHAAALFDTFTTAAQRNAKNLPHGQFAPIDMESKSTPLIVNRPAYIRSSRGVRRYVASVLAQLDWAGPIRSLRECPIRGLSRLWELGQAGHENSIFWTPCLRGPLNARHHVVTVHDCINVEFIHKGDWRRRVFIELTDRILKNAEVVVAISNATKAAILRNYKVEASRIEVIRSGYESADLRDDSGGVAAVAESWAIERSPFILWVTNSLPHKNCERLVETLASIHDSLREFKILVVGSLPKESTATLHRAGLRFEIRDWVDDACLSDLYRHCRFLISPSLDEGHNLAISEAIEHNTNVLCSDIPAHREYYEEMVSFFDPRSSESMAERLKAHLQRDGAWHPVDPSRRCRTFREVASDYSRIFQTIEVERAPR